MDDRPENRQGIANLALLGSFALAFADGSDALIATKKNRALLAILALSPGQQATRERLAGLLWGDRGEEQARSSLRQSLAVLRKELGAAEAILHTRDDVIALRPATLAIDAVEFLKLAEADDLASLRLAAKLYRGDLLADTSIRDPAFDDWLATERHRLADRAIVVLEKLSALEQGEARIETAKRLVGLDNLREASHRALMLAYLEAGENGLAHKQYETCRKLLKDELGTEPAKATQDLRQRIAVGAAAPPAITPPTQTSDTRPSIAVLPFANLSGDAEGDIFCEGLALNIVASLGRFHELFVIDRFSTLAYRGRTVTPAQAARELAVRYILEGSIQKIADRIRVSVQLVDGAANRQLWTETFDRQLTDIFAVQDEITGTIIGTLASGYGGRLGKAWRDRNKSTGIESFVAVDYLQKAMDAFDFTKEGMVRVREHLGKAIECDPGLAKAHSKMAFAYMVDAAYGWAEDHDAALEKARQWAVKAIACDDGESWAHWAFADYQLFILNHGAALEAYRKALACNPNDAEVTIDYAHCLSYAGRAEEAIEQALKAMRLNPHHHDWYKSQLGQIYFDARHYDKAIATFASLRSLDSALMRVYQAASFAAAGNMQQARNSVKRARELDPHATLEKWTDPKLAPYGDASYLEHLRESLRKAGLPEQASRHDAKPSVAVLPFLNLNNDPEQQYFSDGITEDIITGLSHFRHLHVVSRNSSFRFRGGATDIKKAAQELGAHYFVEGSVRRIGERIRVTAQLIDAESGNHVWAEAYDRRGEELFDVQEELLRTIVATLGGRVTAASANNAMRKPPSSLAAYELVLRANALPWDKPEAWADVHRLLNRALEIDPNYARAHALLAAFTAELVALHGKPDRGEMELSLAHAIRAVELDENDSASYSILGYLRVFRNELELAGDLIDRALELNPQNAYAMINKGGLLKLLGHPDEALMWIDRTRQADPYFNPNWCHEEAAIAHFTAHRYEAALEASGRLSTKTFLLHTIEAACHAHLGQLAEARNCTARALQLRPDLTARTIASLLPYKNPADRDHLAAGLRLAGLPEHALEPDGKPSIAVLPFANLSGDPQQDYFADGIAEDIITELGRFSSLALIGRTSSFRFRGGVIDTRIVGQELGVRYLVTGSVRRAGQQVRIGVQLTDTVTQLQLWSDKFDRRLEELFDIQDDVVRAVVITSEHRIIDAELDHAKRKPPRSWVAYDYFLQGRKLMAQYGGQIAAKVPLLKALELDPDLAEAQAHLAFVNITQYFLSGAEVHISAAADWARKAIVTDVRNSNAHDAMGFVSACLGQHAAARTHLDQAIALNPNNVMAQINRATYLMWMGEPAEALAALDFVLEREPFPPDLFWDARGATLFQAGRYREALAAYERVAEKQYWEKAYVIAILAHSGDLEGARAKCAELVRVHPEMTIARLLKTEIYGDAAAREHFVSGLRLSGLPS